MEAKFSKRGSSLAADFNQGRSALPTYYQPTVDEEGILSWANNAGLPNPPSRRVKGDPGDSAYEQAVAGGYVGTEEQFNADLARLGTAVSQASEAAEQAGESATAAAGSASTAVTSASSATISAAQAAIKADDAAGSAQAAAQYASNAATSASNAYTQAGLATTAKAGAEAAQSAAERAQRIAESSATTASSAETASLAAKESAELAATSASGSATSAATSAGSASTSAQQAASSASTASAAASTATTKANDAAAAASAAGDSATSASAASSAAISAKDDAVAAKTAAQASATSATNSASSASSSATTASSAATTATAAQTAAEAARDRAETAAESVEESAAQIEQNRQDIADLDTEVSQQKSALMDISSVISINGFDTLETGYWSTSNGSGGTSLIYVRTKQVSNLLNYDVVFVEPSLNIAIALLAYSGNTYIGAWNGTGWEKAAYKAEFGATSYNLAKFKANYPTYSFRLVLRYVDGSNIDLNVLDGNFFFEKNVLKEIDKNAQDIADIKSGKNNLYDGITLIPGRVYDGVYSDAITTIHCTDYLPITPGRIYAIYGGFFDAHYSSYYDANKIYKGALPLVGLNNAYPYNNSNNFLLFTAPSDAAFTRINYYNSDLIDGNKLKPVWFFRDVTNLVWARKKVLVMGDSISTDVYGGYKKWVTDLLDESFFTTGLVTNNSQHATGFVATYSGQANTTFLARLTAVGDLTGFDAIITFGGINDWIQSIDFDTFKAAVDAYFAYLIENATQARIIVFSPLHTALYGTTNSAGKTQKDYDDYIKSVAKDYAFPCLNLTDESGFCPDKSTTFNDMWTLIPSGYSVHDGVHPIEAWEKNFLAPMIKGFLETIG